MFFKGCEIFSKKFQGSENNPEYFKGSENNLEIIRGLKIIHSEKNKGCETIRGAKFSSAREKGV